MTVYVDDMRRPAQLTGRPARWSHLMADTHDELMQAALDLGLDPEWIQHEGTHREHFDVTETVRQDALARRIASPISYPRGTGDLLRAKAAAADTTPAGDRELRRLPGTAATCDRCGATIMWAATVARESGPGGKPMPLDPIENLAGNVAVSPAAAGRLTARVLKKGEQPIVPVEYQAMTHFATCGPRMAGR